MGPAGDGHLGVTGTWRVVGDLSRGEAACGYLHGRKAGIFPLFIPNSPAPRTVPGIE